MKEWVCIEELEVIELVAKYIKDLRPHKGQIIIKPYEKEGFRVRIEPLEEYT